MSDSRQYNQGVEKPESGTAGQLRQLRAHANAAVRAAELKTRMLAPAEPARRRWALQDLAVRPSLGKFAFTAPRINPLLLWVVVVPTLLSILYFGFIAAPVYVSESMFVVRNPQTEEAPNSLSGLLQGSGILSSTENEAYSVEDYVQSFDAMSALNTRFDLRKAFQHKGIDFIKRFGVLTPSSDEYLHLYYKFWIVDVDVDSTSSIITLTTRAFSSTDAFNINEGLLEQSEALVNKLNEQARQDLVGFAQREVDVAESHARKARVDLSAFRNEKSVIDPERQAAMQLEQVAPLKNDLVAAKVRLAQIESIAPENPQVSVLKNRVAKLESELAAQSANVAGDDASLAHKAAAYDQVELEREFADKELDLAQAFLVQARNEAMQKQLYVERIVQPNRPTVAMEPRRFKAIVATFLLAFIGWLIISLMVSGVREHSD
jgi:capsular polysaccharide transport system permease protein